MFLPLFPDSRIEGLQRRLEALEAENRRYAEERLTLVRELERLMRHIAKRGGEVR